MERKPAKDGNRFRAPIRNVSISLRDLHRALVHFVRTQFERRHGRIRKAGELLELLAHHPEFGWLHTLSELMVDIDELLDNEILTPIDAAAVRLEIEKLIIGNATAFAKVYKDVIQSDPSVVMAHASVRKTLSELPNPEGKDLANIRQARKTWFIPRNKTS